jgi:hypothetical protein
MSSSVVVVSSPPPDVVVAQVEAWEMVDQQGASILSGMGYTPIVETPTPPPGPQPDKPTPPLPPGNTEPEPVPEAPPEGGHHGGGPPGTPPGQDEDHHGDDHHDNEPPGHDEDHHQDSPQPPSQSQAPEQTQPESSPAPSTAATVGGATAVAGGVAGAAAATGAPSAASAASTGVSASVAGNWNERFNQLDEVDKEIKRLEATPNRSAEETARLHELHSQRNQLEQAVNEGIGGKGLSLTENPFPSGECTWYATSRNNLYPHVYGHAKFWGEQAAAAGLEVGEMPVKGAVMVWQPGAFKADARFGHVSFVERVEKMLDGSYKVYYTDNDNMNPATPRSIILQAGEAGVSFIYGK